MRILVTGAAGMVGRNLLADTRAAAHEILAPPRAELDLRDETAVRAYLRQRRPDLIFHLAAVVGGIQANLEEPARFLADNMAIGFNLLRAAAETRIARLVNLGSSCMYPAGHEEPLTPDDLFTGPLEPTSEGYALAKLAAWKLATALGRETPGAMWRTVIPPNLYGRFDNFDPVRAHLMAAAIRKVVAALAEGRNEVTVWGDGGARREFLFAGDLAGFLWTFHNRLDELPETLNVGVGEDHSVDGYYRLVADVLGWNGDFHHDPSRPSGVRRKLLDVSAQRTLGWSPATDLRRGVAAAAAYYCSLPAGAAA